MLIKDFGSDGRSVHGIVDVFPFIYGLTLMINTFVCWFPFSILWFGLSDGAIIFVVAMGSMFNVATAIDNAFRNIPPIYEKVTLTLGADKKQMYIFHY